MSKYDALANDNLIEIEQYHPPLRLQLDEESREYVEQEVGFAKTMLYDWEEDMIHHRAVDIIRWL